MRVLNAAQMREADRRTIEDIGIPSLVLMENAGRQAVAAMEAMYNDLLERQVAVLCGRGNNGGDGLVVARQLHTRFHPRALDVVLTADPAELSGEAAQNFRMLAACGCPFGREVTAEMRMATLVVDALLGTGIKGPATGAMIARRPAPLREMTAPDSRRVSSAMPSQNSAGAMKAL